MKVLFWSSVLVFFVAIGFVPINKFGYIRDLNGDIRLTRIERSGLYQSYGTYFTPGKYTNWFFKPSSYISPSYTDGGPFDKGCFNMFVEFNADTIIVYPDSFYEVSNLNAKFQLVEVPNAYGKKNWFSMKEDTSGKYLPVDCLSGLEK